jgi:glycoprotein endo-alpha-1,2-mannosidase
LHGPNLDGKHERMMNVRLSPGTVPHTGRPGPRRFVRAALLGALVALVLASCGTNIATPTPGATPTSGPSPSAPAASPSAAVPSASTGGYLASNVTAFFYAWYGSDAHDTSWRHWNQNGHKPPDDIASIYYPEDGAFSSRDPAILAKQMAQLRSAHIGVICVSWWGQGGWDDQTLPAIFDAAAKEGIKVDFHLEPYSGQTAASVVADIHYLLAKWGSNPALYRVARPTAASAATAPRPVFYVFAPTRLVAADLAAGLAGLRGTPDDAIVMLHSPSVATAKRLGGDGVYQYNSLADPATFSGMVADCQAANVICAPDVSPGFDDSVAVATGVLVQPRADGARYDAMWTAAIAAGPEWVGVVTFNEWHEGTQIEPAVDRVTATRTYKGYEGAWGVTGAAAPNVYLDRTAYWVSRYSPGK